jgi:hypothetical protein
VGSTPWCPNEPNNRDATEICAALVTACSPSGAALVNDYPCSWPLRVLCAVDGAPECSGGGSGSYPSAPAQASPSGCSLQVRQAEKSSAESSAPQD